MSIVDVVLPYTTALAIAGDTLTAALCCYTFARLHRIRLRTSAQRPLEMVLAGQAIYDMLEAVLIASAANVIPTSGFAVQFAIVAVFSIVKHTPVVGICLYLLGYFVGLPYHRERGDARYKREEHHEIIE